MNTALAARLRRSLITATLLVSALALGACQTKAQKTEALRRERFDVLINYMSGSFASTEQSKADPEYFDIRLHMIPIWPERTDGTWLLVEQAMADSMNEPYRQRVYRVSTNPDGTYRSEVFEFADKAVAASVIGAWNDKSKLANLKFENVALKDGCEVTLTYHFCSQMFTGETQPTTCPSSLRGASYATSEITMTEAGMVTWDKGFDAQGKQVWGAKKGGYHFVKQRDGK